MLGAEMDQEAGTALPYLSIITRGRLFLGCLGFGYLLENLGVPLLFKKMNIIAL